MPIIEEHYKDVDWLPCPDCWSEKDYESEQWIITDSYGSIQLNEDGTPYIDPDWKKLTSMGYSRGWY